MKIIEVDEELYQYIASQTQSIGESASDILRRLLALPQLNSRLTLNESSVEKTATPIEQAALAGEIKEKTKKSSSKKQSDESIQKSVDKVQALLSDPEFQQESKAVVRFLAILSALYRTNPEGFALATETESVQGRTRIYFARDEATLLMAGNHTKPKQIPDSPYWVITNNNSGRKMIMLESVMNEMHLPETLIEQVRNYFSTN